MTTEEWLTTTNKASTSNRKQLEGNNSKTNKGKRVLDAKFSKKKALHMAELIL